MTLRTLRQRENSHPRCILSSYRWWVLFLLVLGPMEWWYAPSCASAQHSRLVFESNFEVDLLPPAEAYELEVFGWKQEFGQDLPRLMEAEILESGNERSRSRVLRLPAGGGTASLTSSFNPVQRSSGGSSQTKSQDHLPVEPGEKLTLDAWMRWDKLDQGHFTLGVRFATQLNSNGRADFMNLDETHYHELVARGGAATDGHIVQASTIVPSNTKGWRLEFRLNGIREKVPGFLELDDVRVTADPRICLEWVDPLRRIDSEKSEITLRIRSAGFQPGDYEILIAARDERDNLYFGKQFTRFVDQSHPIQIDLAGTEFTSQRGGASSSFEGLHRFELEVYNQQGDQIAMRSEPFIGNAGELPYLVGPSRARHGVVLGMPIESWWSLLEAGPTLLQVTEPLRDWPNELAKIPETKRSVLSDLDSLVKSQALDSELLDSVFRWFLESSGAEPELTEAMTRFPKLSLGILGREPTLEWGIPQLIDLSSSSSEVPRRSSALVSQGYLGTEPDAWTRALFNLDAMGVNEVYLVNADESLFRPGVTVEEGEVPQPPWSAWCFSRGFLGTAKFLARERWGEGQDALLFQHDDKGVVALLAAEGRSQLKPIDLLVKGTPRAFNAVGQPLSLPPVENGSLNIESPERFLLIEGIDLEVERTRRSIVLEPRESGVEISVTNHLLEAVTIEPRFNLPLGFQVRVGAVGQLVEPGVEANYEVILDVPSDAGIEGEEVIDGVLVLRGVDGRSQQIPFTKTLPLPCPRVSATLVQSTEGYATVRLQNLESTTLQFHLYLQADGGSAKDWAEQNLAAGESRNYSMPLAAEDRSGPVWIRMTFSSGEPIYCNQALRLP